MQCIAKWAIFNNSHEQLFFKVVIYESGFFDAIYSYLGYF